MSKEVLEAKRILDEGAIHIGCVKSDEKRGVR